MASVDQVTAEHGGEVAGAEPPSWWIPPFEPGNEAAVTHGAYSERRWRPLADRLHVELVDLVPWAADPVHQFVIAEYCRVEAQLHIVGQFLDERGLFDNEGEPRAATRLQGDLSRRAEGLRAQLGIGPLNLAKLLAALGAVDGEATPDGVEALRERGRQILDARSGVLGTEPAQPDPEVEAPGEEGSGG